MAEKPKTIIGRADQIDLPDYGLFGVPAKTDTGADLCAIWASDIKLTKDNHLTFAFFAPGHPHYSGDIVSLPPSSFSVTRVANSFGHKEIRYKVKLKMRLKRRMVRATFTLTDRSKKTYPVLLGRRMLRGKFLVDVTEGVPLSSAEREKKRKLQLDLKHLNDKLRT